MSKRVVETEIEILIAAIVDGMTAYERELLAPAGVTLPPPGVQASDWFQRRVAVAARIAGHWQRIERDDDSGLARAD